VPLELVVVIAVPPLPLPLESVLVLLSLSVLLPLPSSLEKPVSRERTDSITDQASVVVGNVSPASMWKPAAVYEMLVVVDVVEVVEDESLSSSSSSSSSGSELLLLPPELPMSPGGQIGQPESHHKMPILKGIWVSFWLLGGHDWREGEKENKRREAYMEYHTPRPWRRVAIPDCQSSTMSSLSSAFYLSHHRQQ
jgi:hypothetical protein